MVYPPYLVVGILVCCMGSISEKRAWFRVYSTAGNYRQQIRPDPAWTFWVRIFLTSIRLFPAALYKDESSRGRAARRLCRNMFESARVSASIQLAEFYTHVKVYWHTPSAERTISIAVHPLPERDRALREKLEKITRTR